MFNVFPYVFSTTVNVLSQNMDLIDGIVDNVLNSLVNSDFINNIVDNIDSMIESNINFKEHRNGYTIECYLPGTKKEDINLDYENNYITLKVKRNKFYSNNENMAIAVIRPGGDIEEDYYVGDADYNNIRAVFKDNMLRVIVPKSTYIGKNTTIIEVDDYINNNS